MASENTSILTSDIESDISTLFLMGNGYLVTYNIYIACKLNLANIIGEAGQPFNLNEIAKKITGPVNMEYLKR